MTVVIFITEIPGWWQCWLSGSARPVAVMDPEPVGTLQRLWMNHGSMELWTLWHTLSHRRSMLSAVLQHAHLCSPSSFLCWSSHTGHGSRSSVCVCVNKEVLKHESLFHCAFVLDLREITLPVLMSLYCGTWLLEASFSSQECPRGPGIAWKSGKKVSEMEVALANARAELSFAKWKSWRGHRCWDVLQSCLSSASPRLRNCPM